MKRILVLGGAGFIGAHLCKRLLDGGQQVISLDNYSSGYSNNLNPLRAYPHFSAVEHDVTSPFDFEVDEIYNLACPASPVHYQQRPIETVTTNVMGSINALNLAVRRSAKILQASTSEVYGDPLVHPQTESYNGNVNPIGLRACYDEGKRCAETLFFDYHRQKNVSIKVVRIFNTYGPLLSGNDGRVISNFITQALAEKPITVFGKGDQTRSFCYVDDTVDALIRIMDTPENITGPVNIGNPVSYIRMLHLAHLVIELTASHSSIVFNPLPSDDPLQRCPDISYAESLLNWTPQTSLRDGLGRTIDYFRKGHHRS